MGIEISHNYFLPFDAHITICIKKITYNYSNAVEMHEQLLRISLNVNDNTVIFPVFVGIIILLKTFVDCGLGSCNQNHRIIELFELEGTFEDKLLIAPFISRDVIL